MAVSLHTVLRFDWYAFGDWIWASLLDLSGIAPLATFAVVMIAYKTYRQRSLADQRAFSQKSIADNQNAWWSRVQWAVDASLDQDPQRQLTGAAALFEMQDSEMGTTADQRLLRAMADAVQSEAMDEANAVSPGSVSESGPVDPDGEVRENEGNKGGLDTHERSQE